MERNEFIARRKKGIGGSDISSILGLNPFKTPFQLWKEKTGRDDSTPTPDALERMKWGNILEDVVAKQYAERSGNKVQRINGLLHHPECEIAIANIDRAIIGDDSKIARWDSKNHRLKGAKGVLECKTSNAFSVMKRDDWGEAGTDKVPTNYWMQCQWYMGVTGLVKSDLAVLFGGNQFRIYHLDFDDETFDGMLNTAHDWWKRYVVADLPPPPETEDEVRQQFKSHTDGKQIEASSKILEAVQEFSALNRQMKEMKEEGDRLKDLIASFAQDAEAITDMGKAIVTFKANRPSLKTDWQELAKFLQPTEKEIQMFTKEVAGSRVLKIK